MGNQFPEVPSDILAYADQVQATLHDLIDELVEAMLDGDLSVAAMISNKVDNVTAHLCKAANAISLGQFRHEEKDI